MVLIMILLSCVEINPLLHLQCVSAGENALFIVSVYFWIAKASLWPVSYDVGCTISKRVLRYLAKAVLDDSTASDIILRKLDLIFHSRVKQI